MPGSSSHAAELGIDSDASGLTQLELGLDAALGPQHARFYSALLGGKVEDGEPVDPSGQVPTVWWQEPDGDETWALPEQPFEQRWHFDVWVAHDAGERRLQAVLDAGGRLVSDRAAPAYWVVEDTDGNRSCICTRRSLSRSGPRGASPARTQDPDPPVIHALSRYVIAPPRPSPRSRVSIEEPLLERLGPHGEITTEPTIRPAGDRSTGLPSRTAARWVSGLCATMSIMERLEQVVDGIPVLLVMPDGRFSGEVVLWMSHLGGSAEQTVSMLDRFAAAGHPAVSFDAVGHGARGAGDPWEFASGVLAAFRRRMWPILGQTTLEAMRVLTWAQALAGGAGSALAGGVSMGGDVAIALAGIDDRVRRVATVGSTPNWSRPDMRELGDASAVIDQGEADRYAQWFADHLDPSRHPKRYRDGAAITFELGEDDHHVPCENARAFLTQVQELDPAAGGRIRVQTYPGLDHLAVTTNDAPLTAATDWLTAQNPSSGR